MIFDVRDIYNTYFQAPYKIDRIESETFQQSYTINKAEKVQQDQIFSGIPVVEKSALTGREVFLPVKLRNEDSDETLVIEAATIRVAYKNTIIRTPVSERQGTVKEQYAGGDYVFTIKGVLISKDGKMPDSEIWLLKEFAKNISRIYLDNALAELFMDADNNVVIESLEFPEHEGKNIRHKPFVLVCESDLIQTLEVED